MHFSSDPNDATRNVSQPQQPFGAARSRLSSSLSRQTNMANRTLTLSDTPSSRLYCSLQYPPDAQTSMHIHAWQSYAAQKVGGSRTLLARCSPIEVQISVAFEAVLRVNRGDGSRRQQKQQTEESSHLAATPVMTSLHILLWRCRNYTFQDNHYNLSTKPAQQSHQSSVIRIISLLSLSPCWNPVLHSSGQSKTHSEQQAKHKQSCASVTAAVRADQPIASLPRLCRSAN